MLVQSSRPPKGKSFLKNMSYDVQIIKKPVQPVFRTAHPFNLTSPQILCFIMLFDRPDTQKLPIPIPVPCNPTHHPKLYLDRFSHFCTAHGRVPVLECD